MKTVPTVRLADTPDAAALPDLPEDIQLALTDIAEACGPKGKHDAGRAAVRHGAGKGSVATDPQTPRADGHR